MSTRARTWGSRWNSSRPTCWRVITASAVIMSGSKPAPTTIRSRTCLAAQDAGVVVQEFVDRNAAAFVALGGPLSLSVDDVIRTSSGPRHRPGVQRLWQACHDVGDLYRKQYQGLYCVGCEQFYQPAELTGGRCPEDGTEPQQVAEENWFFRLSRYAGQLYDLVSSGRLAIEPPQRRPRLTGPSRVGCCR